jgi:hypothetical protein
MVMENSSVLNITHRDSDIEFSFVRARGEGIEATVEFRVPRADWSINSGGSIEAAFQAQGFEYFKDKSMSGHIFVVTIEVPNIWDTASGATGAHAAKILIQAVGLDEKARFDARFVGMSSERISEAKDHL